MSNLVTSNARTAQGWPHHGDAPQLSYTSVLYDLSVAIYKRQLNTWIMNFPDEELEDLMMEEIVRQTLSWSKKSALVVPEFKTTEALSDPERDSLIQTLRTKQSAALPQQYQLNRSRQHKRHPLKTNNDSDPPVSSKERSHKRLRLSLRGNQNQLPWSNSLPR